MLKNEYIKENVLDSLRSLPLEIKYTPQSHREGLATYFRAYLQEFMKDWANENKKEDGSKYNLYLDGLKIYTTINHEMQGYAEESVKAHMANLQREFFKQNTPELNPTAPFLDLESEDSINIFKRGK
jgi:penicillin-binding protein 1A